MKPASAQDFQHQYVLMLPEAVRHESEERRTRLLTRIGYALNLLFGLAMTTPVRITARYGGALQLLEANGPFPREAAPAEITGAWAGVISAWHVDGEPTAEFIDLRKAGEAG